VKQKKNIQFEGTPSLEYETRLGFPDVLVAGVDEVGRGCLAGPVVAGAVILPAKIDFEEHPWLLKIHDSKKLTPHLREELAPLIQSWALATGIGMATEEEIDRLNIFHASHLALIRAVEALQVKPQQILVDGKFLPKSGFSAPATAVIKGDQKSLSIAAGSIIAKVWRDQIMDDLEVKHPGYGFAAHKGYPTPAHAKALKQIGVSSVHRRTFKTVAQYL
jgi:ribonuclease HII